MTARSPSAFLLSATMHGAVVIALLLLGYAFKPQADQAPKVFELVAGAGDNYAATEAPALGVPGGIKVSVRSPPMPKAEPSPVQRAPVPVVQSAPTKPAATIPDLSRSVKRIANKRETRIVTAYRRQLEAERKAEERRAKEEELRSKRMSKEEFDREHKSGTSLAPGSSPPKIEHINAEGIAGGVLGGSTANTTGGAGGAALTREEGDAIDAYTALLAQKIKEQLDERPGVGAGLIVEVELRIMADGSVRNITIAKSSGSRDFDEAVRDALGKIQLPPRPAGLSELQRFPIRGVADE